MLTLVKETIERLQWKLTSLRDAGQVQGIQTMERMVYFAWLLENKASAEQVKVFIEQAINELEG